MTKAIDFNKDSGQLEHRRLADLADHVVQGDPQNQTITFFKNELCDVIAGTWHAFTDRDEFCFITERLVELIAEDGTSQALEQGIRS